MHINTAGIVLREVTFGDNKKILTVLTGTEGKLTVSAYGTHSKKSKLAAAAGLLVFSHMTLMQRSGKWTLTEAQTIEQFLGLRDDLTHLALGSYVAELAEVISDADSLSAELLPLCLNTLYALSEKIKPHRYIKPAFELRLMSVAGYAPLLKETTVAQHPRSSREAQEVHETQAAYVSQGIMQLRKGAYDAAKYIQRCNPKKLFSFDLDDASLDELTQKTEKYLLEHLDRSFKTLEYYKKVTAKENA